MYNIVLYNMVQYHVVVVVRFSRRELLFPLGDYENYLK